MLKLLAFDYGASSGRAMLGQYNGSRLSLREIHRFSNDPVMLSNSLHWDVLRLYHELKQGVLRCVLEGERDIASIGIDTWGVDFGFLDKHGKLIGNPYHYRDDNTKGMIEKASEIISKEEIYDITGIQFQPFNTLYQLMSMKLNQSTYLDQAKTMLFIPDLFRYFLTGEVSTEYTIASTSQMLDAGTGKWAAKLLDKLNIPRDILTDIIQPASMAGRLTGRVSDELGVARIPVVAVAEHDTASAVVAVPAVEGKYAYLSSGTWSLLGIETDLPVINESTYEANYTNEGGYNGTIRLLKNIMGLWIYQECRRTWQKKGESVDYGELEEGAYKVEGFKSIIDPDHESFYSPGNMPSKVQEFCRRTGQRVPEDKYEIVRCIMESLALKYRMAMEELEHIVGYTIPVLHIVGGGSKNKMLSRFTADAIGKPVIAGPDEATTLGNLLLQLIALGEVKDINEGRLLIKESFPSTVYMPADRAAWDEAYEKFKAIIDKAKC